MFKELKIQTYIAQDMEYVSATVQDSFSTRLNEENSININSLILKSMIMISEFIQT